MRTGKYCFTKKHCPKLFGDFGEIAVNRHQLSCKSGDCREIWQDGVTRDYGGCRVVKIRFRSETKLPTPPHFVRNEKSSFDSTVAFESPAF